jgi:hypothetical protein
MKTKKLLPIIFLLSLFSCMSEGGEKRPFSKEDILKLTDQYVHNNLGISNPAIVDVDGDGDFDILKFEDGNVVYYENTGTIENPFFTLKNTKFDSYKAAILAGDGLPMPVFFADSDGDGDMDLFAVKDGGFNNVTKTNDYRILSAENHIDIDTATLVTIILILVIVLLVLAILR